MKKIILIITICTVNNMVASSQTLLNYSNYEMVFCEEFNYHDLNGYPSRGFRYPKHVPHYNSISGSTSGRTIDKFWDMNNFDLRDTANPNDDTWWGAGYPNEGHERYIEDNLWLHFPGIMRLYSTNHSAPFNTVKRVPTGPLVDIHHQGGYLKLTPDWDNIPDRIDYYKYRNHGYGLIEARIKLPQIVDETVEGSFWIHAANATEIDIFDVSYSNYINSKVFDKSVNPPHIRVKEDISGVNYVGFHTFSVEWSPAIVKFYVDGHLKNFIHYSEVRTFPRFYDIELAIMPYINSKNYTDGQYLEIDWLKIYKRKCDGQDLTITSEEDNIPFFNSVLTDRVFRHKSISISSNSLLTFPEKVPTLIQAEATTINGNFVFDESTLKTRTVTLDPGSGVHTHIDNAYLEIIPVPCEDAPEIVCNDNIPSSKPSKSSSLIPNSNQDIRVYPNPSSGSFSIELPAKGNYEIKVMNMMGAVVYHSSLQDKQKTRIELDGILPLGNYSVQITGEGINHVEKITTIK